MTRSYTRRQFLQQTVAAGVVSLLPGCLCKNKPVWTNPAGASPISHPNILFISVDDLRTQLGCYGHSSMICPHIDQIASEGILFERAYCQMPACGPSRASVLTGLRPSRNRFKDWRADQGAPGAATLCHHFKSHGYQVIGNGKIYHANGDSPDGWSRPSWRVYDYDTHGLGDWGAVHFDKIWLVPESKNHRSQLGRGPYREAADVQEEAYEDGQVLRKSIEDLRQLSKSRTPFFLACGFHRPHLPFNAPKRYYNLYDPSEIALADNRRGIVSKPPECRNSEEIKNYSQIDGWPDSPVFHRNARHAYYACVSYVDALIGLLMAELKALHLEDDTIVVLWGDHGWLLGEHNFWGKHNTLHETLRVPLIMKIPGYPPNLRTRALVELTDLYPTLCALAGLPQPNSHQLDGRSLVPVLKNPDQPWKESVFSEWGTGRAVKTDRYLYTEWSNGSKMLFDHYEDPFENVNIAGESEHAELIRELSVLLKTI